MHSDMYYIHIIQNRSCTKYYNILHCTKTENVTNRKGIGTMYVLDVPEKQQEGSDRKKEIRRKV